MARTRENGGLGGTQVEIAIPRYNVAIWSARDIYQPVEFTADQLVLGPTAGNLSDVWDAKGRTLYVNPAAILAMTIEKQEAD